MPNKNDDRHVYGFGPTSSRLLASEVRHESSRYDEAGVPGHACGDAGSGEAGSDGDLRPLTYKVFTVTRSGLNRDVPPGKESLQCVANSATLNHGERDAVLVDTFLTVEQSSGVADAIAASGKTLKAIYVTHAHGDHFFGIKVLERCDEDRPRNL